MRELVSGRLKVRKTAQPRRGSQGLPGDDESSDEINVNHNKERVSVS